MRNNTRGLVIHIFVGLIIFLLAFFINLSKAVREIVYGNLVFRVIISLVPIILYYNFAKLLSKRQSPKLDYLSGNLIVFFGLILFLFGFLLTGRDFFSLGIGTRAFKFPAEIFLTPQIYMIKVLRLPYNAISLLIFTLLPTLIYGFSLRVSREKIRRQRSYRRNSRRRYES